LNTTGKTSLPRHFCRYPARRENLRNRKLPAKPLSHGTFAGIPRDAKIFNLENYRQNLSPTALLPVSRATRKSSKLNTTGKISLPRHFCRYPARRENFRNRKLPAKPLSHGTFAGIPRDAKIFEIGNYRQNLSPTALLPVSRDLVFTRAARAVIQTLLPVISIRLSLASSCVILFKQEQCNKMEYNVRALHHLEVKDSDNGSSVINVLDDLTL